MSGDKPLEHVFSHLEPQILNNVEVRNPSTKTQLLPFVTKYENRYTNRETQSPINNIGRQDLDSVRYFQTDEDIETGGIKDALSRLVVEKTITSLEMQPYSRFNDRHPGTGRTFSKGSCVFSNMRRCLAEGHLASWLPLHELLLTPNHQSLRLEYCRSRGNCTTAELNHVVFSDESRFCLSSVENRVVCGDPVMTALFLPSLYSDRPPPHHV
ncbi:uncharacterized protein TNCV_3893271 [Trichonephila clavipes]|nr:uncharacterized protein TNCV_3893271 [Trichonephila clavipes]